MTVLPDGSAFFTSTVMSKEEAMKLPVEQRPLNMRISSEMYHAVWEAIGAATRAWNPKPDGHFLCGDVSNIATNLCFKIAKELEARGELKGKGEL